MGVFQDVTFTSKTTSAGPNILLPVDMPATVVAGDILEAFVQGASTSVTGLTGWTNLGVVTQAGNTRVAAFRKVAVGTEGGTVVNFRHNSAVAIPAVGFVAAVVRYQTATAGAAVVAGVRNLGTATGAASPRTFSADVGDLTGVHEVATVAVYDLNASTSAALVNPGSFTGNDRGSVTAPNGNSKLYVADYIDLTGDLTGQSVGLTITASVTVTGAGIGAMIQATDPLEVVVEETQSGLLVPRGRPIYVAELPYFLRGDLRG